MTEFKFNLAEFDYEIVKNHLIIRKKIMNISDLLELDLTNSYFLIANYNNKALPITHKEIVETFMSEFTAKELKKVLVGNLDIIDGENLEDGYCYIEKINISYYSMSVNESWKIIKILLEKLTKNYEFKIKLNDERIIDIKK